MILAFDLSDLPTDAIVIFAMVAVSFLGWLKNKFLDKPEEIETPDQDDPMREIIWRRQMGENSEETRMPWEEPEVVTPTIRFDPPPVPRQTAAPSPPPPPLPSVTEVSAKEENLADAFERRTRRGKSGRSGHRRTIDRFLRTPSAAKDAILLTEILGPPVALKAEQRTEP